MEFPPPLHHSFLANLIVFLPRGTICPAAQLVCAKGKEKRKFASVPLLTLCSSFTFYQALSYTGFSGLIILFGWDTARKCKVIDRPVVTSPVINLP